MVLSFVCGYQLGLVLLVNPKYAPPDVCNPKDNLPVLGEECSCITFTYLPPKELPSCQHRFGNRRQAKLANRANRWFSNS